MPLTKSKGNMYEFVDYVHTHLGGECLHRCSYCYVGHSRFGRPKRYRGQVRLIEKELKVNYERDKTIFIEHCHDLFADGIPTEYICKILNHCSRFPHSKFILQTKNPDSAWKFYFYPFPEVLHQYMIGTTIESNRDYPEISKAPKIADRVEGIKKFAEVGIETFVTIEPILDFDVKELMEFIRSAKPKFVNIGADSKRCGLPELSANKIQDLITELKIHEISVREKSNLKRLTGRGELERKRGGQLKCQK